MSQSGDEFAIPRAATEEGKLFERLAQFSEIGVVRLAGIEAALALERDGKLVCRWNGPTLLVRRVQAPANLPDGGGAAA